MKRSKLRNIINKAQSNPYNIFVNSLPEELNFYKDGGKYRLKAAWKAYGMPKNYKEAIYNGLIINSNYKQSMASIGYDSESNSYEYLNTGRSNEEVDKDLSIWDNDTIPLIKELKLGGYIKIFDEEKNCWKYEKRNSNEDIEFFKLGGKPKQKKEKNDTTYAEFLSTLPENLRNEDENTYRMRYLFDNEPNLWTFDDGKGIYFNYNYNDGLWHARSVLGSTGEFLKSSGHPSIQKELEWYYGNDPEAVKYRNEYQLITTDFDGKPLKFYRYIKRTVPNSFKLGGKMNVIPEGALHARKNGMELAKDDKITSKGIPVVDNNGVQQAEIERDEIIFCKRVTEKLERFYKNYNSEGSEKDDYAIECGKYLVKEILENTEDRTGLIESMSNIYE